MFTRDRRGRGWLYRFVGNAEALVEGRRRYVEALQAYRAAITGTRRPKGRHVDLDSQFEARADGLRRRKAELDRRRVLGKITATEEAKSRQELECEIDELARTMAARHRQELPRKHGD